MALKSLRDFIEKVEETEGICRIQGADPLIEIGAITEVSAGLADPRLLLFDKIKGHPEGYRVASNVVTSPKRAAIALGLPSDSGTVELVRLWKAKSRTLTPVPPKEIPDGPVMENSMREDKVDLSRFPAPKWHELDGGRYLGTGCMLITKDPEEAWVNLGCYRMQLHDKDLIGVYISPAKHGLLIRNKYWEKGKSCPCVATFGQDPALWIAAASNVPYGMSEYEWAGWVKGEPIEIVLGPSTGLPIPSTAEIAIEGEIPPIQTMSHTEGPFGEWPGYYAHGAALEPVIKVKAVYYRTDPIIHGAPPMKPPNQTIGIPFGAAAIWENLERMGVPDVRGVWCHSSSPSSGGGQLFIVISLKQRYIGHAKQAAMVTQASRTGAYFGRWVIVVDEDIDPTDLSQVIWAMATRCDPDTDVDILKGGTSTPLDPRLPPDKRKAGDFSSSRIIVNACKPYQWLKEFPPVTTISTELRDETMKKWWKVLGMGLEPQ